MNRQFDNSKINFDSSLTKIIGGRAQFNFESGNYSDTSTEVIVDYISKTLALND